MAGLGALAPAGAVAFAEVDVRPSPKDAIATCLRYTGEPGQLALLGPLSRRAAPTDFVEAGASRLTERGRASVGALVDCAAVAAGGKTTVVAGAAQRTDGSSRVTAVVRGPDGSARSAPLGASPSSGQGPVAAAVSARGDVLVAWVEVTGAALRSSGQARIMAARKTPGKAFGPPEELSPRRPLRNGEVLLSAGLEADGGASVAWARPVAGDPRYSGLSVIEVRSAAAGARFEPAQRLARRAAHPAELQLRTAPDGRALIAYSADLAVVALERAPDATRFQTLARFGGELRNEANEPAVAIRPDGGALVAWRFARFDGGTGGVTAALRSGPGPLGPAVTVDGPRGRDLSFGSFVAFGDPPFAPVDEKNVALSAALSEDGRAVLGWTAARALPFGDRPLAPRAAAGTLDGGFGPAMMIGCPCRATNGIVALVDARGAPALAWTDNVPDVRLGPAFELPAGGGRLHLAYPGSRESPAAIAPRVRLSARGPQRLHFGRPVGVEARCDRPCDLRALVPNAGKRPPRALATASLGRAGRAVLRVTPSIDKTLAPRRPGRVGVIVRAYAPNTNSFSTARVAVRLSRLRVPPTPLPRDVRARRQGRSIIVTWRTRAPARRISFLVEGRRRRAQPPRAIRLFAPVQGRGRTRFRARLELKPRDRVRFVAVTASGNVFPSAQRTVVVPVELP